MTIYDDMIQLAAAAEQGNLLSLGRALRLCAVVAAAGEPVSIAASLTISNRNADLYNGRTLVFSAAFTVTLDPTLPSGFGFTAIPPASGSASIAAGSGVTLNGAASTITRDATNAAFAVITSSATDARVFVVTGL